MSSRHLRAFSLVLALLWVALVLAACEPQVGPEAGYKSFLTAVAKAPDDGYSVYWLGREFQAGGLTFKGPEVGDFGDEVVGGGVGFDYEARLPDKGGVSLRVTLYSPAAWEQITDRRSRGVQPRLEVEHTEVAGRSAELKTNFYSPGVAGARILMVDMSGTVVEATTGSYVAATPGGQQPNSLMDAQTFLGVMQNLRLYPE